LETKGWKRKGREKEREGRGNEGGKKKVGKECEGRVGKERRGAHLFKFVF